MVAMARVQSSDMPSGLHNLGHTCFFNTMLQVCIVAYDLFICSSASEVSHVALHRAWHPRSPFSPTCSALCTLQALRRLIWQSPCWKS
jgi:hypothetical protein